MGEIGSHPIMKVVNNSEHVSETLPTCYVVAEAPTGTVLWVGSVLSQAERLYEALIGKNSFLWERIYQPLGDSGGEKLDRFEDGDIGIAVFALETSDRSIHNVRSSSSRPVTLDFTRVQRFIDGVPLHRWSLDDIFADQEEAS